MPKDSKRINELPGIAAGAVVALNRIGILTHADLLAAEFDRVAYIVEDFNEAARLVREAKRQSDAVHVRRGVKSTHADPHVPSPLSPSPAPTTQRSHHRSSTQQQSAAPVSPVAPAPRAPEPDETGSDVLMQAMAALANGLTLFGETAFKDRATLARRLSTAAMLLDEGASEPELLACALLESVEAGQIPQDEIAERFGKAADELLEQCAALRAVPMLPSGKPPRYYLEMARGSSREARRICAAHLLSALDSGPNSLPGGTWYAKLLLEGLEAGGPDELVAAARAALDEPRRQAA